MNLFEQIGEDIKAAMKARDKVRLDTLRNIKKVFLEAKTAPGANDTLTDADALKIISKRSSWHNRAATRQPTEIKTTNRNQNNHQTTVAGGYRFVPARQHSRLTVPPNPHRQNVPHSKDIHIWCLP